MYVCMYGAAKYKKHNAKLSQKTKAQQKTTAHANTTISKYVLSRIQKQATHIKQKLAQKQQNKQI